MDTAERSRASAYQNLAPASRSGARMRIAAGALLVGLAYYAGAVTGLALRFSGSSLSAIWPPNAILLVALLLTPPRRWWVYLLAAVPAHYAAQAPLGVPIWRMLWQVMGNMLFATLAAHGVRRLTALPLRFDSLRQVAVYLVVAVVAAPAVVTFVTAAPVLALTAAASGYGEWSEYLVAWRQVFLSNALANLTLAPALLLWLPNGATWFRAASARRRVEALLLGIAVLIVSTLVFDAAAQSESLPALIYAPLPLLLLAAGYFGPAGASAAIVAITFVALWHAMHGHGPFLVGPSSVDHVFGLQMFVVAMAVPLLLLASVLEERRRADRALRASEERFRRAVLDAPIPIMLHTEDGEVVQRNRSWTAQTGSDRADIATIGGWAERAAGDQSGPAEAAAQSTGETGGRVSVATLGVTTRSGERRNWEITSAPLGPGADGRRLIVSMATDVTKREQEQQQLELRVAERTADLARANLALQAEIAERSRAERALQRANAALKERVGELSALNRIAQALTLWANFPETLETIGPLLRDLFAAAEVSIGILDGQGSRLELLAVSTREGTAVSGPPLALGDAQAVRLAIGEARAAIVVGGPPIRLAAGSPAHKPPDVHQILVPIRTHGVVVGLLHVVAAEQDEAYTPDDLALAQTVSGALASVVENARLFEREHRQRQIAMSLHEVAAVLTASLELETVVRTIFEQLRRVVRYDGAAILVPAAEDLVIAKAIGLAERSIGRRIPLTDHDPAVRVFHEQRARIVDDTEGHSDWVDWKTEDRIRCWMGAPLVIGGSSIGVLTTDNFEPNVYDSDDLYVLQVFAHQAAIAIDNARRYEQAQQVAAEEERRRLARDLHDSVSQALFSASLTADVLPQLWERDIARGMRALDDLRRFTRGAQAEMRTLLLELRPATLAQAPLDELLSHLASAAGAKVSTEVHLRLERAPALPADVQVALYRIAQEALTNTVKHACARQIVVRLQVQPALGTSNPWRGTLTLEVSDDGRGFDPAVPAPGHMGLENLCERAAGIGATLRLVSAPGAGTQIITVWSGEAASAGLYS